jgi:hypothetical protein
MVGQCPMAAANWLVGQADHARGRYGRCNWRVARRAPRLATLARRPREIARVCLIVRNHLMQRLR